MTGHSTWSSLPGNWDTVHTEHVFPSDNPYGIPNILPYEGEIPQAMVRFKPYKEHPKCWNGEAMHFYCDDYKFETVWSQWRRTLPMMQRAGIALTPDFSLYRDWPIAVQIWNVYRSRWMGAFWQSQGIRVVPSMQWSTPNSYDFAFVGLPRNSVVALTSQTVLHEDEEARVLFVSGFMQMLKRLEPSMVLCYGKLPLWVTTYCLCHNIQCPPIKQYATRDRSLYATIRKNNEREVMGSIEQVTIDDVIA